MSPHNTRSDHLTTCLIHRLALLLIWLGAIVWLSLTSAPPTVAGWLGWDKLQHAVAYGVLAWLLARVLVCWEFRGCRHVWWQAWVLTVFFGLLLEFFQHVMQRGRVAEWQDLVADGIGALIACVIFRQTHLLKSNNSMGKKG